MQCAVAGVYHLYFGDASKHPIVGNYVRSLPELPQKFVLQRVPNSRFARLWSLIRELIRVRRNMDWALQCHDVVAAVVGCFIWKGRIIYDSHEIYSSFAPGPISARLIASLENFAIRNADITVFPSTYRSQYYDLVGQDIRIIENFYYPYCPKPADSLRERNDGCRQFIYTGLFTPARAIDSIIAAFARPELRDDRLILAGKRTGYLDSLLADAPSNVEYVGELGHEEVTGLMANADAGFALYRPINENNRRCAPTKVFEFLYFGLSVITNRSPYVDEISERRGGHLITSVAEISTGAIAEAASGTAEFRAAPLHVDRDAVCWESQMHVVKSLYT